MEGLVVTFALPPSTCDSKYMGGSGSGQTPCPAGLVFTSSNGASTTLDDATCCELPSCGGANEASCGTCTDYDVDGIVVSYGGQCQPAAKSKGYANVDMDAIGTSDSEGFATGQAISVVFATKQQTTDSDNNVHRASSTYDATATHATYG